ncbi:hypothetical protein C8Q73DRAFT_790295 [Cubamyces lactineus]|nr:hypothetical protein C8Q73DRAFT_790295 [Cubamyces lactineus]
MPPKKRARTNSATPRRSTRIARADLAANSRLEGSSASTGASSKPDGACTPELALRFQGDSAPPEDLVPSEHTSRTPSDDIMSAFQRLHEGILNMPLDILIEIFCLVSPRDLLALARTSKDFRSYLMSRRSAPCWRSARHTVPGLPKCPSDLSEPMYASLLFTEECSICGRVTPKEMRMYWQLRVRYCPACAPMRLAAFTRSIRNLCDKIESATTRRGAVLITVWSTYAMSMCCDIHEYKALITKWKALKKKEAKQRFAEEQMDLIDARFHFANEMATWTSREQERKRAEAQALRQRRYKQIVHLLKAEGWAEELARIKKRGHDTLSCHQYVQVDRALARKEWPSIRQSIVKAMENYRAAWRKESWLRVLAQRLDVLFGALIKNESQTGARTPEFDLQAQAADLCLMPTFRQVVYANMNTNITAESFEPLLCNIPAWKAQWYAARKHEFERLVKERNRVSTSDTDVLNLAVASFRCAREQNKPDGSYQTALLEACGRRGLPFPWVRTFEFNPNFQSDCTMIRASGFDPNTATFQQMDNCGLRFFCQICSTPAIGYQEVYTWKTAINHTRPRCDTVFGPSNDAVANKWCILDGGHAAIVRELEDAILQAQVDTLRSSKSVVYGEHGVASPEEGADYYVHLDTEKAALDGPITIYPTYAKTDRIAVKDVNAGRAFFSPSLFMES